MERELWENRGGFVSWSTKNVLRTRRTTDGLWYIDRYSEGKAIPYGSGEGYFGYVE